MNIAIDARWIFREMSGIAVYTQEIISRLAGSDRGNNYLLLFDKQDILERTLENTGCAAAPNFRTVLLPYGIFTAGNQLRLPSLLRREAVNVYHSTNYMIPFLSFPRILKRYTRCVVTIHDVIPLILPDHAPRSKKARVLPVYRRLMKEVGIRSDAVVADSEASRRDIILHMGLKGSAATRVHTVYCGVSERFRPPLDRQLDSADSNRVRKLLYVGRADPYKNIETAVRTLALLRESCSFPVCLTLVGRPDPRYPEVDQLISELSIEDSVKREVSVSDDELVSFYQNADILIHPSMYEGFGLQVAEAMACGLPVICSNRGSLPEVAGDAALLHDPDDIDGFAASAKRILTDRQLAQSMSEKGVRQAAMFTWKKTAEHILQVYERVAT